MIKLHYLAGTDTEARFLAELRAALLNLGINSNLGDGRLSVAAEQRPSCAEALEFLGWVPEGPDMWKRPDNGFWLQLVGSVTYHVPNNYAYLFLHYLEVIEVPSIDLMGVTDCKTIWAAGAETIYDSGMQHDAFMQHLRVRGGLPHGAAQYAIAVPYGGTRVVLILSKAMNGNGLFTVLPFANCIWAA